MPKKTRHWVRLVWKKCPVSRSQYIRSKVTVLKGEETIQGRKLYEEIRYIRIVGIFDMSKLKYVAEKWTTKARKRPAATKIQIGLHPFTRTTFCPLYSSQLLFLVLTTTCLAPLWRRQNLPGFFSQLLLSLYSTWFKMKLICGLFSISFLLFCINCDAKTLTNQNIIELCPTKVPKVNGTFKHELTTLRQAIEEVGSRSELRYFLTI